jgi:hypothetical protein
MFVETRDRRRGRERAQAPAGGWIAGAHRARRRSRDLQHSVVSPEHVVHVAFAALVRDTTDLELALARLVERPPGFLQQQIDEVVARLRSTGCVGCVWA